MSATEHTPTLREVLREITAQGVLDQQALTQIEQHHAREDDAGSEPWFVKLLITLGAWVAAICFVACLSIADLIDDRADVLFPWAAGFLGVATALRRATRNVFPVQLALALSVVGHGFALAGAAVASSGVGDPAAIAIAAILLCVLLYPLYCDALHRFLSCVLAAGCLTAWIVDGQVWQLLHVEMLVKIVAIGIVFMYRTDLRMLRPLGYAMAISVPANLFLVLLPEDILVAPWWPANLVLATAMIWLYAWVAGGWQQLQAEPLLLAAGTTLCLATFTTPGILAALGLMVLGYARGDRYLLGMGIAFFPVFIVIFYYEWQISLLIKSWVMAGSGAVLLVARWWLGLRRWSKG